jgi:hypothetical protein
LNLSERFGESNGAGTILDLRLTHQDLANMIASAREAVSKAMSEFQREGTIEVQNRKIVLLNREALAEGASGPTGLSIDGQSPISIISASSLLVGSHKAPRVDRWPSGLALLDQFRLGLCSLGV